MKTENILDNLRVYHYGEVNSPGLSTVNVVPPVMGDKVDIVNSGPDVITVTPNTLTTCNISILPDESLSAILPPFNYLIVSTTSNGGYCRILFSRVFD